MPRRTAEPRLIQARGAWYYREMSYHPGPAESGGGTASETPEQMPGFVGRRRTVTPPSSAATCCRTPVISGCAKRPIKEGDGSVRPIEVRCDEHAGAYLAGVLFCSSPWFCPRCSPKVLYRRGQEIDRICRSVFDNGGSIFLLTLTVRHSST